MQSCFDLHCVCLWSFSSQSLSAALYRLPQLLDILQCNFLHHTFTSQTKARLTDRWHRFFNFNSISSQLVHFTWVDFWTQVNAFDCFTFTMSISPQNVFTSPGLSFIYTAHLHRKPFTLPIYIVKYGCGIIQCKTHFFLGETQGKCKEIQCHKPD